MKKKIIHYQYGCKCLECFLHFVSLSWRKTWGIGKKYCPECGSTNIVVLDKSGSPQEIYEVVSAGYKKPLKRE